MNIDLSDFKLIAEEIAEDFLFYSNKKIFITGGTGFFGKWVLEAFSYLNNNHGLNVDVTILSRSPDKFKVNNPRIFNHKHFNFILGDIRSFVLNDGGFDLIIHAATEASVELNRSNPELMRSTIMDGAKRILEFSKKVGCKRMLYTSSGAVYGPQPQSLTHMPETFINNPEFNYDDAYASAKLESEKYFLDGAPCEVVIARCFAFSGPYLPLEGSFAFGNFVKNVLDGKDIVIKGDGTAVRSYLYAADLVIWLLRILSSGRNKETYNVGSPKEVTIKELANAISLGEVEVHTLGVGDGNKNVYVPCVQKAETELDLKSYTSLEESIFKTFNFYSKNLNLC